MLCPRRVSPLVAAVAVACSSYAESPGSATDAGTTDAGATDAGASDANACADKVVYVAEDGRDTETGCDPTRPKRSIGGAIAYLATNQLSGFEIRVCGGTYPEEVKLSYPASIRGGYECATWKRDSNLAAPTVVTTIAPAAGATALTVTGAAVDRSVVIEGLRLRAPNLPSGLSVGLLVEEQAAPRIEYVDALGGKVSAGQSFGLRTVGASPAITRSRLVGGEATCATDARNCYNIFTSAGVVFDAPGAPSIADSTITGGTSIYGGKGGPIPNIPEEAVTAGFVNHVALTGDRAFARNKVAFGGTKDVVFGAPAFGIVTYGELELVDSTLERNADAVTCSSTTDYCSIHGVMVGSQGSLRARGLRIFDPDIVSQLPQRIGVRVVDGTASIDASAFYLSRPTVASISWALMMNGSGRSLTARGNTMVSGAVAYLASGSAAFTDNLLVVAAGPGVTASTLLVVHDCATPPTPPTNLRLDNNVIVEAMTNAIHALSTGDCAATGSSTNSLAAAEATLNAADHKATGNKIVRPTCDGETACIPCSGGGCVLAGWGATPSHPADGDKLLAAGFALASPPRCSLSEGGSPSLGDASPRDLLGKARTKPYSIGASEDDSTCTP